VAETDETAFKRLRHGRHGRLASPGGVAASPTGFEDVRLTIAQAATSIETTADRLSFPRSFGDGADFEILAISGGAVGGAFGAGVLIGLTRVGRRPCFELVTGVSTGALIAPFAFLGPKVG
jgi:predicted acylesterase/phospholipase RssA